LQVASDYPTARAFAWLASGAASSSMDDVASVQIEPGSTGKYEESYMRFIAADAAMQREFAGAAT
jgi:hypothetical protein